MDGKNGQIRKTRQAGPFKFDLKERSRNLEGRWQERKERWMNGWCIAADGSHCHVEGLVNSIIVFIDLNSWTWKNEKFMYKIQYALNCIVSGPDLNGQNLIICHLFA